MSTSRALFIFRIVFVAFIVFASAMALSAAGSIAARAHLAPSHLIALASAEIAAAIGFLWRRTERPAAAALIAVFAIATILDARTGDIPVRYAYYAATVLFIVFLSRRQIGDKGSTVT